MARGRSLTGASFPTRGSPKPGSPPSSPSRLWSPQPANAASARARSRYFRILRVAVLDGYAPLSFATFAEEIIDLKSVLLDHRENPLAQFGTLCILLLDFLALDARLHLRQFGIRHHAYPHSSAVFVCDLTTDMEVADGTRQG
jgi:hypothetical protein